MIDDIHDVYKWYGISINEQTNSYFDFKNG